MQPEEGGAGGVRYLQAAKGNAVGDRHPITGDQIGGHLQHEIRARCWPDHHRQTADRGDAHDGRNGYNINLTVAALNTGEFRDDLYCR